ncbi:HDOD domain-containing protein [Malonomonas rubra]|uniref:HDOD domain-containing protein n=1 Tax=Malonomonas rubra TaxID=57040 RepID=UPI0026EE878A|nr:HDOD domain-containing protein [Malonomonas rubra]
MTAEEIIKSVSRLVSLPDAVMRASHLLDSPDTNIADIGEVIAHDPALSARLLKLVNSAFYHFPGQIGTLSRAITLIGFDELRSLLVASASAQCFNQLAPESIDMNSFWKRSVYCGLVAQKLASLLQDNNGESMFLTGLLHDIGHLILLTSLPEQSQKIVERAGKTGQRMAEIETELLGFNAPQLGALLLENWQLPKKLWEPVGCQLQPENATEYPQQSKLLHLALAITDCVEPELKTEKKTPLEGLRRVSFQDFDLTIEQLEMLAIDASLESFEVLSIINPQVTMIF